MNLGSLFVGSLDCYSDSDATLLVDTLLQIPLCENILP